ncbi:VanZ family protein [Fictibacillus aquaticus]|uniref:VanZ-like domain-containing protein n=1 Tax=Fictibacillus aquaticus TaxID=2021314 RepID=A0A235FDB7_9BACL|nr:VanZ family protein [Fictibacillus aquaticus]OYD59346.1 hypothetical protein CGZ90_05500 [Fictibacillus aquaticus]
MVYLIDGNFIILLGLATYLIIRGIMVLRRFKRNSTVYWIKETVQVLFVLYLCMLVSVTLFPIFLHFQPETNNLSYSTNFVPLASIMKDMSQVGTAYGGDVLFMIKTIIRNVGGNIFLFFPLGFILPLLFHKFRSVNRTVLIGFVISISIECLQFLETFSGMYLRTTDVDDVICNVLGVLLGFLLYKIYCKISYQLHLKVLRKWMA